MIRIRQEQHADLQKAALSAYQAELLDHFRVFAPELFRVAGEEQFRKFVQYGTDKSLRIGLNLRGPMRLFLDLMCILGQDFDIDPQYRPLWPEGDPAAIPMPFAQRLHANFGAYLDQCVGADKMILAKALRRVVAVPLDPADPVRRWTHDALDYAYPEKLAFMGEDNFYALLDRCDETADRLRLATPRGRALVAILALSFGVNFLSNPLYPWVERRLLADAEEDERVERTFSALRTYASEMLKNLQKEA
jgi:hypothetical protein